MESACNCVFSINNKVIFVVFFKLHCFPPNRASHIFHLCILTCCVYLSPQRISICKVELTAVGCPFPQFAKLAQIPPLD